MKAEMINVENEKERQRLDGLKYLAGGLTTNTKIRRHRMDFTKAYASENDPGSRSNVDFVHSIYNAVDSSDSINSMIVDDDESNDSSNTSLASNTDLHIIGGTVTDNLSSKDSMFSKIILSDVPSKPRIFTELFAVVHLVIRREYWIRSNPMVMYGRLVPSGHCGPPLLRPVPVPPRRSNSNPSRLKKTKTLALSELWRLSYIVSTDPHRRFPSNKTLKGFRWLEQESDQPLPDASFFGAIKDGLSSNTTLL